MLTAIKNLLGFGPKVDYAALMKQGAVIVDVRSKAEYAGGHIRNSINIPVDALGSNLSKLANKNQPIITCCASGMTPETNPRSSVLKKRALTPIPVFASFHVPLSGESFYVRCSGNRR
jgi:hypothetical protein